MIKKPDNNILVIFGASGDLTMRKLVPSLFSLFVKDLLPERFAVLGTGRTDFTTDEFRIKMKDSLSKYSSEYNVFHDRVDQFINKLNYVSIDTSDEKSYSRLYDKLLELDKLLNIGDKYIYYMSTPPSLYEIIPKSLKAFKLNVTVSKQGSRKLVVEKPFGTDLESARKLNKELLKYFKEEEIYRIDHYLGKESVQNVLVTRFSNSILEPLWKRNYVDHVEITSAEDIGIENRGGYYDKSGGALRDMVQNHLMQIAGLIAMEPPSELDARSIRNETHKVIDSIRPIPEEEVKKHVVRGQYSGNSYKGTKINSYREEKGVNPNSKTETFVALKFYIDNWRWGGVPFLIRTGKHLPTKVTEAVIHFKSPPLKLFKRINNYNSPDNQLIIRIQPDEGILLKFGMKVPGAGFTAQTVNMDFHYKDLKDVMLPSAYERLLLDCMNGDGTLFSRGDTVEMAWEFIQPILNAWENDSSIPVYQYSPGSWGPEEADKLFDSPSQIWRYPCRNLTDDGRVCEL